MYLFILVEGTDDERFFQNILEPRIDTDSVSLVLYRYSCKTQREVNGLLQTIYQMGAKCIFVSDKDGSPCFSQKKNRLINRFNRLDQSQIVIADREIESWYISGLDKTELRRLGLKQKLAPEEFSKERLAQLAAGKFPTNVSLLLHILSRFNLEVGISRCASLRYLVEKLDALAAEHSQSTVNPSRRKSPATH